MRKDYYEESIQLLEERGVTITDIAEIVLQSQRQYVPTLTIEDAKENVRSVLRKREVQNVLLTGIELDKLTEQKKLSPSLQRLLEMDNPLYGVDEVLVLSICNIYGSIGLTNYGYLDKAKPLILSELDKKIEGKCNVFLDDLVAAIAAAACSRIAHNYEE